MAAPADSAAPNVIKVSYSGRIATITIDNERKLNALDLEGYYQLARTMREVASRDDIYITVLTGKGRYFSAGADVGSIGKRQEEEAEAAAAAEADKGGEKAAGGGLGEPDEYRKWLYSFVPSNLNLTRAFYTHPKVLVVALNGPVVGLSAALTAFADFIYAAPHAFLLAPFASLGLVAEGGASRALARRLGPARAAEALLMARRIPCDELLAAGYVNKVIAPHAGDDKRRGTREAEADSDAFLAAVMDEVRDKLGDHLVGDSLLGIKALLRAPENDVLERQNVAEVFAGLDRFVSGVPAEEFRKIATGQKKHKL